MDRALDLNGLRLALGQHGRLPTPERLQQLLADAEIEILRGEGGVSDELLQTAWFLHAVGSARAALRLYTTDRQRRAHQVSAHIFDLALPESSEGRRPEHLQMMFAAQIGYLRGGLDPNALALYRRLSLEPARLVGPPGVASLTIGIMLLALDRRNLFRTLQSLRSEISTLSRSFGTANSEDLSATPMAAAADVVAGVWDLLIYLTYGAEARLDAARARFEAAVAAPTSQGDVDSRWVAAHLLDVGEDLRHSSVWAILPPQLPRGAGRAMTFGDPPVMSMWPPQLELLQSGDQSILLPQARRLVVSFPTSAGKTLLAQLIVVAHLVSVPDSNVCYVTPTHSLCREVRQALDRRLGTFGQQSEDGGPLGVISQRNRQARVVVMTPEKLSSLIRSDPRGVLDEFSLFIIDEAHLIADKDRGWALESALTLLQVTTARNPQVRIVLLSAALGNRMHIQRWMDAQDTDGGVHHDWRGPRRAHAVFTTQPNWGLQRDEPQARASAKARTRTPMFGSLHLRVGRNDIRQLRFREPLGDLVLFRKGGRDQARSTPRYRMLVPVVAWFGGFGPVLVVEPTRSDAQRFALALAAGREPVPETRALTRLASLRLGPAHPLVNSLERGVGFHHAALPADIQAELEDAVRTGELRFLVSTTTLAEGINLPVRTVVIAARDYIGEGGVRVVAVDAARLLNAAGRAGRAGRETEGWVVLVENAFEHAQFEALDRLDAEYRISSVLHTAEALHMLAAFEELINAGQDAVFEFAGRNVADFISYIWYLADVLGDFDYARTPLSIRNCLTFTLAWREWEPEVEARWMRVAELALEAYEGASTSRRRRWARSGMALPAARRLEDVANELFHECVARGGAVASPNVALEMFMRDGRMSRIIELLERPPIFRPRRNASRADQLRVDTGALMVDWVGGVDLPDLAGKYLGDVTAEDFRYEQLSEYITQLFEHHLPWTLGTVIGWVNQWLSDADVEIVLCPDLPAYIRYGVATNHALYLMLGGIRSRRLATTISRLYNEAAPDVELLPWLRAMSISQWREMFAASSTELADLILVARVQGANLTARALEGETVEVSVDWFRSIGGSQTVDLRLLDEERPARLGIWQSGESVGAVRPEHHGDMELLLAVGVPYQAETDDDGEFVRMRVLDLANAL